VRNPPANTSVLQMSQAQNSRTVKLNNADNEATIIHTHTHTHTHTIDRGFFYPRPTAHTRPVCGTLRKTVCTCTGSVDPGAVCGTNAMKWLQKAGGAHDWRSKARAGSADYDGRLVTSGVESARQNYLPFVGESSTCIILEDVFFHFRVLSTIYVLRVYTPNNHNTD